MQPKPQCWHVVTSKAMNSSPENSDREGEQRSKMHIAHVLLEASCDLGQVLGKPWRGLSLRRKRERERKPNARRESTAVRINVLRNC